MRFKKIKTYPLKLYIKKWPIAIFGSLAALANLFSWAWITLQIPDMGGQMFLHYNVLFGVDYIGEGWRMFLIPLLGLIIFVVNMIGGWLLYRRDAFMSYLLVGTAALCQIFVVIATILVVFLNV